MASSCVEAQPSWTEALARRLGFSGRPVEVPPERRAPWCAEGLERLAHAGERQGVELLVGWPARPGAAELQRWVARLAHRAPLRRFVHAQLEPDGSVLVGMLPPGRFEAREVLVRLLDDETESALGALAAGGREHLALKLADVLGREALTQRFFRAFRRHLGSLEAAWIGLPSQLNEDDTRRDLAMTTLCRLMFVTFLARAGRLGPVTSARWLVEQPRRASLYRDVLRPLFFGALNTPNDERGEALAGHFRGVPFLNGGLFQPLAAEESDGLDVADDPLLAVIDELLEGYDFTARERDVTRAVPAIDPEMLGQVFEALMQAEERRGSGAFYTPPRLVRTFVTDALEGLAARVSEPARAWVEGTLLGRDEALDHGDARRLASLLAGLRVLDPAVGSGAFLLGALEALLTLRHALSARLDPAVGRHELARAIITQNLYGVDLSLGAVRLCELRLWLSLAVEAPPGRPLDPLPNLDHRIRQGDSLAGPHALAAAGGPGPSVEDCDYSRLHGPEKDALARRLRMAEVDRLLGLVRLELGRVEAERAALDALRASRDLFGERLSATARQRRSEEELDARRLELEEAEKRLTRGELPFFSYQAAFPEAFAEGGFDLVIGNPPWVRLHSVHAEARASLRRRFRFARGLGSGFHAQVDLSVLFVERAFELAAQDGLVGLLLPAKLFRARYGRRARAELAKEYTVLHFADLSRQRSRWFAASNYPAWLLAGRGRPEAHHLAKTTIVGPQGSWLSGRQPPATLVDGPSRQGPWVVLPEAARAAFAVMREGRVSLLEYGLEPALGLKTGLNRVFLCADWEAVDERRVRVRMADGSIFEVPSELAPLACHGRDLAPFAAGASTRVLAAYDQATGRALRVVEPALAAYFERHAYALDRRRDARAGAAPWRLFRTRALQRAPRVVWRDIAPRLEAVFLPSSADLVPLNTAYFITPADRHEGLVLAALLNSRWVRLLAVATAEPAMSGYSRFMAWTVGRVPWPSRLRLGSRTAVQLANLSAAAHEKWTPAIQHEIDERVAWSYGLGEAERAALDALVGVLPGVGL